MRNGERPFNPDQLKILEEPVDYHVGRGVPYHQGIERIYLWPNNALKAGVLYQLFGHRLRDGLAFFSIRYPEYSAEIHVNLGHISRFASLYDQLKKEATGPQTYRYPDPDETVWE